MSYYLDTGCLYYWAASELNSGFFICKIPLKQRMSSCFFDKTYKNKIGWGHAWGGCVNVTDMVFPNIQQNLLCVSLCTICFSLLSQ